MKKMFFLLLLIGSIGMYANAQDCRFVVTDAKPSISGTRVTISVTVKPAFTPSGTGHYEVVIKPEGQLRNILDSQSKSVEFYYNGGEWVAYNRSKTVEFYCSVDDNTYNQCNSNSFSVSTCYKKP